MLLIYPVEAALRILPILAIPIIFGTREVNSLWLPIAGVVAACVVAVIAGSIRWATTKYRIGPVYVELRRGVFQKKLLSVPRSRIRSVDVQARVLHRLLGMAKVSIGTGQQSSGTWESNSFELDALPAEVIPALRAELLAHALAPPAPDSSLEWSTSTAVTTEPTSAPNTTELAHWQWSWVRYAPFSLTGIVAIAAAVGAVFQFGLSEHLVDAEHLRDAAQSTAQLGLLILVIIGAVGLLVTSSIVACVRYLVTFGKLHVNDTGRALNVSHGLLQTKQSTLDRARLRGTTLREPLLLRLAGGARLNAIMTGVSAETGHASLLMPQSPRVETRRVMAAVLHDEGLAQVPLREHGPAARRRRYVRALSLPVAVLVAGLVIHMSVQPLPVLAWVAAVLVTAAAIWVAHDRYRGLGHAVAPGWLITSSGSLDRSRDTLAAAGIIGWTVRQSFFQRRAGVATIVAATPAGTGSYEVVDIPVDQAWALVEAVTPGGGDVWINRGPAS
ncbi:MAG: PH domain-containing protein [Rhodococcus sp.]|nr:PH domain-containing protein [Rhodococcus sp. (in: high G+C Gram-positive bacteria)]